MKKFISLRNYRNRRCKHVEEITRLQKLLVIEEQALFELIQTQKQILDHERPIIARSQERMLVI
ncbi:MAG TPA: hypothetical protein PK583_03060 [Gammaproteobacteria bacterium]|nr:hypothetical protein [Gammaproteobacteria bacterium]HRA43360.1 hypothetical protein [Gammaproteobacteria bacterium]